VDLSEVLGTNALYGNALARVASLPCGCADGKRGPGGHGFDCPVGVAQRALACTQASRQAAGGLMHRLAASARRACAHLQQHDKFLCDGCFERTDELRQHTQEAAQLGADYETLYGGE
jgi:hypothetical protein